MLTDRKELLKQARLAVHEEGYQYSKKRSRSKQFGSESGETEGSSVKRVKVTKDVRRARIDQLKEQLKTTNTHILFKEERIRAGAEKKNFKLCDLLTEEVEELQQKRREFEIELHALNKKDNRAKRYELKKHMIQRKEKDVQSSSDSEALFTPVSTGHSGLLSPKSPSKFSFAVEPCSSRESSCVPISFSGRIASVGDGTQGPGEGPSHKSTVDVVITSSAPEDSDSHQSF